MQYSWCSNLQPWLPIVNHWSSVGFGMSQPGLVWMQALHSWVLMGPMCTVWKFHDFSINHILYEINFGNSISAKSANKPIFGL